MTLQAQRAESPTGTGKALVSTLPDSPWWHSLQKHKKSEGWNSCNNQDTLPTFSTTWHDYTQRIYYLLCIIFWTILSIIKFSKFHFFWKGQWWMPSCSIHQKGNYLWTKLMPFLLLYPFRFSVARSGPTCLFPLGISQTNTVKGMVMVWWPSSGREHQGFSGLFSLIAGSRTS